MNPKTWPEYPPQGPRLPKFGMCWVCSSVIAAAAAGLIFYAQQPRSNAVRSDQAVSQQAAADAARAPKPGQLSEEEAALADSLVSSMFPTFEDGQPVRRDLPWAECLNYLDTATVPFGGERTEVIRTEDVRVVRLAVGSAGGSVLLTCTRLDNTLTIMTSPTPGAAETTAPPSKP